jgi:hypothetical protein
VFAFQVHEKFVRLVELNAKSYYVCRGRRLLFEWQSLRGFEIEIKEMEWEVVDWVHLVEFRKNWEGVAVMNVIINLRFP